MSLIVQDQAARLRRMVASQEAGNRSLSETPRQRPNAERPATMLHRTAHVVAIASGKGGVGKTNIAVNLAIRLSQLGRRVVLVDADLGTANADVLMNVQAPYDLSHVLRGERRCDEVAVRVNQRLRLIVGASGLAAMADASPMDRQVLIEELSRLEQGCDVIILDCGAGVSENVLAFARSADELWVVTTPEPTALTDGYALVKSLSRRPCKASIGVVINQTETSFEGRRVAQRISNVAERFLKVKIHFAGHVLYDPHVALAVRRRVPMIMAFPRCRASTCISTLARTLDQACKKNHVRSGIFRRVIHFFD